VPLVPPREVLAGIGGAPSTDNNIILTSIRYYLLNVGL
jgi:hypothetical protein